MSGSLEQDPTVFADLIGRNVEIESKSGLLYHGKCLSVDPISGSLIIIKKDELLLLPWVEMDKVKVTKAEDSDKVSENMNFFQELLSMHYHLTTGLKDKCPLDSQTLEARRDGLETWLKKNHLSAQTVSNKIIVQDGLAVIDPPYEAHNCKANNAIVLQRVASIVASFQHQADET